MAPAELLPPRYGNARLLGEGSFATVFVAYDSLLGREVAVKVLREELTADPTIRRRFAREVRTVATLGAHPNVVTVYDAGEWLERPYLVMELLAGSVAQRLHDPVPEPLALRWLAQSAAALDFAHAAGIIHRDVKPANLLLDERGDVRVADFGVARGGTAGGTLTLAGFAVGTPGYLAPEIASGGVATAASDLYSLAVVALELLGGRPALGRGLAHDPDDRYPSASALVRALGADDEPTRVLSVPVEAPVLTPIPRTEAAPLARTPRPRRRRAVRAGLVAVSILAAAALGAAVGGAVVAEHLVSLPHLGAARVAKPVTCALSPVDRDANVVVKGVDATSFCRAQARLFRQSGDDWTYRAGGELFAPDNGIDALGVVCGYLHGGLRAVVYDSGSQSIGAAVCDWFASDGWRSA